MDSLLKASVPFLILIQQTTLFKLGSPQTEEEEEKDLDVSFPLSLITPLLRLPLSLQRQPPVETL